jgi:hypothetical protein
LHGVAFPGIHPSSEAMMVCVVAMLISNIELERTKERAQRPLVIDKSKGLTGFGRSTEMIRKGIKGVC